MKRSITNFVTSAATFLLLSACNSTVTNRYPKQSDKSEIGKNIASDKQYCFMKVSGNQNRDTLTIVLRVDNDSVTGEMTDAIFEKDSRRGKLSGHQNEKNITANWTYIQEGIIETLQLEFMLENGQLLMAPLVYDTKSGKQKADSSSSSWIVIPESACQLSENEQGLTVKGVITAIAAGKDGYTAKLKKENGDSVQITMSRVRLQKNYRTFQIGERVIVSGDTIHVNQDLIILVNLFNKDN